MATTTKKRNSIFGTRKEFLRHCRTWNRNFFTENQGRYYVEYVRDPAARYRPSLPFQTMHFGYAAAMGQDDGEFKVSGRPTAVMVAVLRDSGKVDVGWSAAKGQVSFPGLPEYRPAETFCRDEGLWRATRRAIGAGRPQPAYAPDRCDLEDFRRRATEILTKADRKRS